MRHGLASLLALSLCLAGPAAGSDTPSVPAADPTATTAAGTFGVTFAGTSTLHGFEGHVPAQPLSMHRTPGEPTWAAAVSVPVAAMTTGNTRRDAAMRTMLDAERFPEITAAFAAVDVAASRGIGGPRSGSLPFVLRILNVEQALVGTTSAWREDAGSLAFDVRFPVSLAAFALTPPSVLGLVRVGDVVDVAVHVELHAVE